MPLKILYRLAKLRTCALLIAAPLGAQGTTRAPVAVPAAWATFTRQFDATADSTHVVGGSAVLVRDGRIIARHNYGFGDRARGERVTDRTLFHYASITKTLTAIAIMQLRDRGRLSLDDPVTRWVPELRQLHDPYGAIDSVTIRMLLSHTSGFQNLTWPYGTGAAWEPFEPTTWAQLVAMMPYQQLLFRPGSRFSYSNPAYIYLARVIEALTGDPWSVYVQKNILSPLGLSRSYFGATPYYLAADRSNNYTVTKDSAGTVVVHENGRDFDPGITIPNGGWNAPLDDMATYVAFLTGSAHGDTALARRYDAVLSRATLQEMWRPVIATGDGDRASMGLGFYLYSIRNATYVGHDGCQAGFTSYLLINPANATAVAAAINTTGTPSCEGPLPGQRAVLRLLRE
ncbi:MAG: serine hydrolase domain-containing protein [Gemmatimonadales bacterium]